MADSGRCARSEELAVFDHTCLLPASEAVKPYRFIEVAQARASVGCRSRPHALLRNGRDGLPFFIISFKVRIHRVSLRFEEKCPTRTLL